MNSKRIGNIGEAVVLAELTKMGIPIYIQFGDNESADYIIIVNSYPFKVQVKTSETFDGEKTKFDLVSSTTHRKNGIKHKYTIDEVDLFLCYDIKTEKVFIVQNTGDMSGICIRYTAPKNNQIKGINFSYNCTLCVETLHEICNNIKSTIA